MRRQLISSTRAITRRLIFVEITESFDSLSVHFRRVFPVDQLIGDLGEDPSYVFALILVLGRRLEHVHPVVLCELLGSVPGHYPPLFHVVLVTDEYLEQVFVPARSVLLLTLLHPRYDVLERLGIGDVIDEHDCVHVAVVLLR